MQNVKHAAWRIVRSDVNLCFWLGDLVADVASKVELKQDEGSAEDFVVVTKETAWKITVDNQNRVTTIAFRGILPELNCCNRSIWNMKYQDLCEALDASFYRDSGKSSSGNLMKVVFRDQYAALVLFTVTPAPANVPPPPR